MSMWVKVTMSFDLINMLGCQLMIILFPISSHSQIEGDKIKMFKIPIYVNFDEGIYP